MVSEVIEGETIDTEVEKTGGNKEEKLRQDEHERNGNGGAVREDTKGVMTDTAIEQYKIRVEDENERNAHGGVVSEDIKGVTTDSEVEQTGGNKEDKTGSDDENERNVNSGAVSEDIEGVMTD